MEYRTLGRTGIEVSLICLGTMTWGSQNSEAEAHEQLDHAVGHGVNFIDTAEAYPVTPVSRETQFLTETYIGNWIAGRKRRDDVIVATKIAGPTRDAVREFRGGNNRLDRRNVEQAVEDSLRRLRTDYIDLYQVHWPDRPVPSFGARGLTRLDDTPDTVPIEETLGALADLVRAGKIRHFGVSNETPWGVSEYLRLSREKEWPRVASIQNAYNLLNRTFEHGLSEYALREQVSLLAYSPLAGGNLTGKYLGGRIPAGSRRDVSRQFVRYDLPGQPTASARYVAVAQAHGLPPAQLALAFVNSRPFVTSTIIGATSLEQLKMDLASVDVRLDADALAAIEAIHRELPDPCP
ncbi:NADP(H)-dependent aldo-keto reductase [Sphingobium fuliginis]|jgi:aryl-alcohol dehydrogenase-like predicted oxidoreductase|uniref:Protein tas n=1 Tax=Sphingobium fuliginis (strain ATCC 27551) TaxID=336203 RepID=A0A292ZH92_SPHSA|nr:MULTISPECIES: NADP(H)-dependent aldo-keto reductase [Sphingobium]PNP99661.1 aldo/keto reductase [Sphingobium sp. SA916]QOT73909.1 NADP(H)-dependent aldo-keto reductase [Sphingobium fuliginis]GAY24092.1 oxidoreductase [Sphingobium fuliginis]